MTRKKINILILSVNFPQFYKDSYLWKQAGGGAEKQLLLLVKKLMKIKYLQFHVICKRFVFKEKSHIKQNNLNIIRIYTPNKLFTFIYYVLGFLAILKIHQKSRINVIHVNPPILSLPLAYFTKKLLKIPIFYKFPATHTKSFLSPYYYPLSQPFFLRMIKNTDRIQCITPNIYESASELGFSPEKLIEIPNGIDITPYLTITRNSSKKIRKLLFMGRFTRQKGVTLLLKAFSQVLLDFPDISLSIFGKGADLKKMKNLIHQLNLKEKITISSFHSERERLKILRDHDLFILPSYFEGLSNALLEALCSGLPVLVSDIKANKNLIQDEYTGILFKTGNINSLKDKIIYCLNNSEKLWNLGAKARELIKDQFSIDITSKEILKNYVELTSLNHSELRQ